MPSPNTEVRLRTEPPHVQLAIEGWHIAPRDDEMEDETIINAPTTVGVALALVLQIDVADSSASTKYRVARGVRLPSDHLLTRMFHETDGQPDGPVVRGRAAIPFKNNRAWIVECEAIRLGEQVFGLFHLEQSPVSVCEQPRLFPE